MNISQLLESTSNVAGFGAKDTFGKKKFGEIYLYNKTVRVKPGSSIIEVTMMIKGMSDKIKPAKESSARSVAAHKVMIAIRGVKQESVSQDALIQRIKDLEIDGQKPYLDWQEDQILSEVQNDTKLFKDKTIFKNGSGGYVIVDDHISKDCDIRVWCSCSSYYWVFQFYNVQNKTDIWMKYPDKYTPKTKEGWEAFRKNKPMRNPGKHPGMCKHIMLLLAILMEKETVAEARSIIKNYKANYNKFKIVSKLSAKKYNELIEDYKSDHRRKNAQRQVDRATYGYAQRTNKKPNQQGWMKHLKWVSNPNSRYGGTWRPR